MDTTTGVALIAAGAMMGLVASFGLARVAPVWVVLGVAAAAGGVAVSGFLLVRNDARPVDWVLALPVGAFMVSVHTWLVFRPAGRPSEG